MARVEITAKNFNTRCASLVARAETMVLEFQDLLEFGFKYYLESDDSNTLYISKAYNACVMARGYNANKMKKYLTAALTNCKLTKDKNGNPIWKHDVKKKGLPSLVDASVRQECWDTFKVENADEAPDINKAAQAYVNKMLKAEFTASEILAAVNKALTDNKGESAKVVSIQPVEQSAASNG